MAQGDKMTTTDGINWLITRLNNEKKNLTSHFVQSLVCQFCSDCTQCPLFLGLKNNTVECANIVKE